MNEFWLNSCGHQYKLYYLKKMGRLTQLLLISRGSNPATETLPHELLNFGVFGADTGCYSPPDIFQAQQLFNANCGPAAFAAIRRTPVSNVMGFFPYFPSRDWTTVGDMRKALHSAETPFCNNGKTLPEYGLALLQLRVNDRPLHPLYSLSQTHWVGVCRDCFYDVNWGGWLPVQIWRDLVLSRLSFGLRPVCGWEVRDAIAVLNQEFLQVVFEGGKRAAGLHKEIEVPRHKADLPFEGSAIAFPSAC